MTVNASSDTTMTAVVRIPRWLHPLFNALKNRLFSGWTKNGIENAVNVVTTRMSGLVLGKNIPLSMQVIKLQMLKLNYLTVPLSVVVATVPCTPMLLMTATLPKLTGPIPPL